MNHQERLELLAALSRAGVSYYKSHDLEIKIGSGGALPVEPPTKSANVIPPSAAPEPTQDDAATEKLKELISTLKMDDAALVDKIFPAGAGL